MILKWPSAKDWIDKCHRSHSRRSFRPKEVRMASDDAPLEASCTIHRRNTDTVCKDRFLSSNFWSNCKIARFHAFIFSHFRKHFFEHKHKTLGRRRVHRPWFLAFKIPEIFLKFTIFIFRFEKRTPFHFRAICSSLFFPEIDGFYLLRSLSKQSLNLLVCKP